MGYQPFRPHSDEGQSVAMSRRAAGSIATLWLAGVLWQ
jgi:hypothetical protein